MWLSLRGLASVNVGLRTQNGLESQFKRKLTDRKSREWIEMLSLIAPIYQQTRKILDGGLFIAVDVSLLVL